MSDSNCVTYPEIKERWIGLEEIKLPEIETPWDLQYQSIYVLHNIKDLLEECVNPNYMQEGETLYENVLWKLREGEPDDYDFQRQLVQLLLAYGGKSPTYGYTCHFEDPNFDIEELKELLNYQTYFRKVDNKYCKEGYIINVDTGKEIARL